KALLQYVERGLWVVRILEQIQILWGDHVMLHQRVEVDDLFPILRTVEHGRHLFRQLLGLRQGEDLHHLVERAEAARKDHQRFRQIGEPELAHEKVVELEAQLRRDIWVGELFERQTYVQSDGFTAGIGCAAIGGFHNSRTAAGTDNEPARA